MSNKVKEFWDSYRQAAIASGVPVKNAEWFVKWAEKFAVATKGKPIRERSVADIRKFLFELSIQRSIQPWQVHQAEEALVFLYEGFFKLNLGLNTVRPLVPATGISNSNFKAPQQFKDRALSKTEEKARYGEFYSRFRSAMRVRHYSIRTTMIYTHVLNRPGITVKSPADY